jgi:hypothetical protein
MDGLKKSWLVAAAALLMLSGCGLHRDFVMPNLPPSNTSFVVDATQPDENPAFLAGEGNVYSCQFAIHHMRREDFTPPKERIFEALLAKELPEVISRRVVLERFDVYMNGQVSTRLAAYDIVVSMYGGLQYILPNAPINERAILEMNPQVPAPKGVKMVGCEDRAEGAYNAAYGQSGHNMIVTWLAFSIDGVPYVFRSNYLYQAKNMTEANQVIDRALRATVGGVAERIRPALSERTRKGSDQQSSALKALSD